MNPEDFPRAVQQKAAELKRYTESTFPSKGGNVALRFINGNFRAQGFQGATFKKWKNNKRGGTILVNSAKLRAANYFTPQNGQFTIKNPMPYAKIHNEGGLIKKKASKKMLHFRIKKNGISRFSKLKNANFSQEVDIKEHDINMPQRQFIPTEEKPSTVLNQAILRMVARDIEQIMK